MSKRSMIASVLLVWLCVPSAHAQVTVTEIPPLDPGSHCWAADINEGGDVLVECGVSGAKAVTAFIWSTATATATRIPEPDSGTFWWCPAVNDAAQVICNSDIGAILWSRTSGLTPLVGYRYAYGLNDLGDVLAMSDFWGNGIRRADGTFVALPPNDGFGARMNNLSQVLLQVGSTSGVWSPTDGFVPLPSPGDYEWVPQDINDAGQVLAIRWAAGAPVSRGMLFDPSGGWSDLAHPPHLELASSSGGVNVLGQVSGIIHSFDDATNTAFSRAFFWPTPDAPVDLGDYFGMQTWVSRGNAAGQVVGSAYCSDFTCTEKALVWSVGPPVPSTPAERIDTIQQQLEELAASGALPAGDAAGLEAKLQGAAQLLEKNDAQAASNILKAASNQVTAWLKSKRISQADADILLSSINSAIASL